MISLSHALEWIRIFARSISPAFDQINFPRNHSPAIDRTRISRAITRPHSSEFESSCAITSSRNWANYHCARSPPFAFEFESPKRSLFRIRANSNLLRNHSPAFEQIRIIARNHKLPNSSEFEFLRHHFLTHQANSNISHDHKLPHLSEFQSPARSLPPALEWIRILCDHYLVEQIRIFRAITSSHIWAIRISSSNYTSSIVEEVGNVHYSFLSKKYGAYTV